MNIGRLRKQVLILAAASVAGLSCAVLPFEAVARSGSNNNSDWARRAQEREQERQERAAERARQQAEQQAEERAKQSQSSKGMSNKDNDQSNADQAKTTSDQGKAASVTDSKASEKTPEAEKARVEKEKAKVKADALDDDKTPNTVAEWLGNLFKPATPAPKAPAAPVVKTTGLPIAPALPPNAKPDASKPILTTGSTPTLTAKAPVPAPAVIAEKLQKPGPGRLAPRDGLPAFPAHKPEVLASNMSSKSLEKAVALGFTLNGTSRVTRADLNLTRLIAPDGMSADQARELLKQSMPSETFGVNQTYHIYRTATGALPASQSETVRPAAPMATPCGTDRCFGSTIMHWQQSLQACSRGIKVGVIDTGYDATHPTFNSRVIETRRSVVGNHAKSPDWHGTGVLALLAGDGKSGTPGLIPEAKFYAADIFYAGSDGLPSSDTASLLDALDWMDKRNVNVINMSLSGPPDDLLKAAIDALSQKNVIFVAAAGNDGPNAPPSYPAAYSSVIAVTAISRDMKSYRYASRGDHIDVAAPGVDIWTALPGGRAAYHSGTSFAVPYVTAVLATAYKGLPFKNKNEFFKRALVQDLGEPGRDPIYGRGLLLAPATCSPEAEATVVAAIPSASNIATKATLQVPAGLTMQVRSAR